MSEYKYITTYTFPNGDTWKRKTYSYPNIIDYTCPKCGLYPMNYSQIDMGEWDGYKTICGCELCGARYDEGDPQLKRPKGSNLERCVMGILKPCTDISEALIGEENLSSVAKGLKESKDKKVKILVDNISNPSTPICSSFAFKNFTSLAWFKDLGFDIAIEEGAIFLSRKREGGFLDTITLSIKYSSQKTYIGCALKRSEIEALNLFWDEYDEMLKQPGD